jgi:hypothetical protein
VQQVLMVLVLKVEPDHKVLVEKVYKDQLVQQDKAFKVTKDRPDQYRVFKDQLVLVKKVLKVVLVVSVLKDYLVGRVFKVTKDQLV